MIVDETINPRGLKKYNASCSDRLPARYVLSFLTFWGMCLESSQRVCLSVTIVAMVNHTHIGTAMANNTTDSYCPIPEVDLESRSYEAGQYDWSPTTQGIILGAYFYGFVSSQLIGGRLAEIFGGKWLLGGAVLAGSLLTFATPVAAEVGVPAIVCLRVILGLVHGTSLPTAFAMFAKWAPAEERSTLVCLCKVGDMVGTVLSMPLAGYLCEKGFSGGWPSIFYILGTLGCMWFFIWIMLAHNSPAEHPRISEQELEYIKRNQDSVSIQKKVHLPWRDIATSLPVWSVAVAIFTSGWCYFTVLTKLPTYFDYMLHIPIQKSSFLCSIVQIFSCTTHLLSGYTSDYLRSKEYFTPTTVRKSFQFVAVVGCAVCTALITTIGCNQGNAFTLLVFSMAFIGLCGGGEYSIAIDMAPQYAGTIFGLANGFGCISGILAPLVAGLLLDDGHGSIEQWNLVFYSSAGMSLISALVFTLTASAELQPWARENT